MRIDLHLHSTASDGALPPAALVAAAAAGNLDLIALADHDTVAGIADARVAAAGRLDVLPAIELSTTREGRELHVLGYYIDPEFPALREFGERATLRRQERMRAMIHRLEGLGIHVEYDDVAALAGANVGRPHLARVLLQNGHVRSFGEAFERFIGDGGPAFVAVELLTPSDAIHLIHEAGGVASWAHPPLELFEQEIAGFAAAGLDAVEAIRPRTPPVDRERLARTARELGLMVTGGSDWHGDWNGPLGDFALTPDEIPEFLALGGY